MTVPNMYLAPSSKVLVATDLSPSMFSDAERTLIESSYHCANAASGFRTAVRTIKRLLITEVVLIGPANSRALQYLVNKADHAGINVRRLTTHMLAEVV